MIWHTHTQKKRKWNVYAKKFYSYTHTHTEKYKYIYIFSHFRPGVMAHPFNPVLGRQRQMNFC